MFSYTVNDADLNDFFDVAWSGGKDRLNSLRKHCMETNDWSAWDYLDDYMSDWFGEGFEIPTETDINDFLWFESDDVLKDAGYLDEDYCWTDGE